MKSKFLYLLFLELRKHKKMNFCTFIDFGGKSSTGFPAFVFITLRELRKPKTILVFYENNYVLNYYYQSY